MFYLIHETLSIYKYLQIVMKEDTESAKILGEEFDNALSEELSESENSEQKLTENENNEEEEEEEENLNKEAETESSGKDVNKEEIDDDIDLDVGSLPGVGPISKKRLVDSGIYTVMDIAVRGASEIADVTSWDLSKAEDLSRKAREKLVELGKLEDEFVTASELHTRRIKIDKISTGTESLDDLLGGGIETQGITEFYGEFGTGKTQICNTLCVMSQLPKEVGGLKTSDRKIGVIFVDTEGTFRPDRIIEIAKTRGFENPESFNDNIFVAKAYNSAHQEIIVQRATQEIRNKKAEGIDIRLMIVDSIVAHFRAEFLGRGTLSARQQRLNKFVHLLLRVAETHDIAVVGTNQVHASPDSYFGDPIRPTGGHVLGHTSTYRIYVKKAGKNRIARMVDSPSHPDREVLYTLNEKGIDDPESATKTKKK